MSQANPLHASYYADDAVSVVGTVSEHWQVATDTWQMRIRCPEMAARFRAGQFLMLRLPGRNDPLIGRPFAIYQVIANDAGVPESIDVMYIVKGNLTKRLVTAQPGDEISLWGPLGNGFSTPTVDTLVMVAGGIGQTPFVGLAEAYLGRGFFGGRHDLAETPSQVTLCYGARSAEYFAGLDDFRNLGLDLRLATDDGSAGHHGLVTEVVQQTLDECRQRPAGHRVRIACCGPEPMMEAVAAVAQQYQVPCEVSLETPMACGIGICFTCVARIVDQDGEWDYKRTCVEGPVFAAEKVVW